jgi:hypothetical protein
MAGCLRICHPYFDLWAVASKEELNEEKMQALALEHMTPV